MKINRSYAPIVLISLLLLLSYSCNKDSYIEGVGFSSEIGSTPSALAGRVTFYCTDANVFFCSPNGLEVKVNSVSKGRISDYSPTDPGCGSNSTRALTLTLAPGSYTIEVSGAAGCGRYNFTLNMTAGECYLQALN